MIVGKTRGPANTCALLLLALAASGCLSELGPGEGKTAERAGGAQTADEYCDLACSKILECDSSQNVWNCDHGCNHRLAADGDVVRHEFVRDLSSCYLNRDCVSILDGSAATDCQARALTGLTPSQQGRSFCDQYAQALERCGAELEPAACLDYTRIFTDPALSAAAVCLARPCAELDTCVALELGSAPISPAPCDASPPLCLDASEIRWCIDGYYATYDCSFICNGHGFDGGECAVDRCQCGEPANAECERGAAAVCACIGCTEEEQRSIYVSCQLDTAPFVSCYGAWAGEEGVDCASASEHCL